MLRALGVGGPRGLISSICKAGAGIGRSTLPLNPTMMRPMNSMLGALRTKVTYHLKTERDAYGNLVFSRDDAMRSTEMEMEQIMRKDGIEWKWLKSHRRHIKPNIERQLIDDRRRRTKRIIKVKRMAEWIKQHKPELDK